MGWHDVRYLSSLRNYYFKIGFKIDRLCISFSIMDIIFDYDSSICPSVLLDRLLTQVCDASIECSEIVLCVSKSWTLYFRIFGGNLKIFPLNSSTFKYLYIH